MRLNNKLRRNISVICEPLATFSFMKRFTAALFLLTASLLVSGCAAFFGAGYEELDDYAPSDYVPDVPDSYYEPDQEQIEREMYSVPETRDWACRYSETLNYDWHDDVICNKGMEFHRPYLLEGSDFVTYDDIMAAATEYELYLNAQ